MNTSRYLEAQIIYLPRSPLGPAQVISRGCKYRQAPPARVNYKHRLLMILIKYSSWHVIHYHISSDVRCSCARPRN